MKNELINYWELCLEVRKDGTAPGDVQIPLGIYGSLFHFEKELFLFKIE